MKPRQEPMTRRSFLITAGVSLSVGFIYLWNSLINKEQSLNNKGPKRRIKLPIQNGVTFFEDFYIIAAGNNVKAYSTRCTHAGCLLKQEVNGIITCPCHGSRFDAITGNALRGPAFKPLKPLACQFDRKTSHWVISMK